jgi:hypothetical protein
MERTLLQFSHPSGPSLEEEASSAPNKNISTLPPEMLMQIFSHYLHHDVPPRRLALVCKRWRSILLSTPAFWTTLEAHCEKGSALTIHILQLQRRIELLGQASTLKLHITLNLGRMDGFPIKPFKLVIGTGIERWDTLNLMSFESKDVSAFAGLFTAGSSFKSLRTISFFHLYASTNFEAIEDILLNSPPPKLEKVTFETDSYPPKLRNSPNVFRAARKVIGSPSVIRSLKFGENLEELWVRKNWSPYFLDGRDFPVLPRITHFETITRRELASLKVHQVSNLHIVEIRSTDNDASFPCLEISLPKLTKLKAGPEGLYHLRNITAPALEDLEVVSRVTARGLAGHVHTITVRPISLGVTLWEEVLDVDTARLFKSWNQLEHLHVSCRTLMWTGSFEPELLDAGGLFPGLRTLKVGQLSGNDEMALDTFRGFAEKMLRARKRMDSVAWRMEWHKDKEWHRLSRSDLEG